MTTAGVIMTERSDFWTLSQLETMQVVLRFQIFDCWTPKDKKIYGRDAQFYQGGCCCHPPWCPTIKTADLGFSMVGTGPSRNLKCHV
jgi:hypothetical protein